MHGYRLDEALGTWKQVGFHGDKVTEKRVLSANLRHPILRKYMRQNVSSSMALIRVSSEVLQELWFQHEGYIFTVRIGQLKCQRIAKFFLQKDFLIYFNPSFLCLCKCWAWVFGCLCVCAHVCTDVQLHGCAAEPEVSFELGLLYTLYYWGSVLSLKPEVTNFFSLTWRFALVTRLQPPNAGIAGRLPWQTSISIGTEALNPVPQACMRSAYPSSMRSAYPSSDLPSSQLIIFWN